MLKKAIKIAYYAHIGQVDKAGAPYILHPIRVMTTLDSDIECICAVLHDVVEDSDITFDYLREEGFSEEVIQILDCVTKRPGESYDDFIGRIIKNETACKVKLADLCDNMNLSRIEDPTEKDEERLVKYRYAAGRIADALSIADKYMEELTLTNGFLRSDSNEK